MGSDLYLEHACAYRPGGAHHDVHELLVARRHLARMQAAGTVGGAATIAVRLRDGTERVKRVSGAELDSMVRRLESVFTACERCPANFKGLLGIQRTVGCNTFITLPLDTRAENILLETLTENARPERLMSDQGNFVRALVASQISGARMMRYIEHLQSTGIGHGISEAGRHQVRFDVEQHTFHVSVYAVQEALFLRPVLPLRALADITEFCRAFFAVVGRHVCDRDGRLDSSKNAEFWQSSRSLRELNLFVQALHHAKRLGVGIELHR